MIIRKLLTAFSRWHFQTRPVVDISACIGCGGCKPACTAKALELFPCIPEEELPPKTGEPRPRAEVNYRMCSRCYRCKEICPRKAISVYRPLLMRLLRR